MLQAGGTGGTGSTGGNQEEDPDTIDWMKLNKTQKPHAKQAGRTISSSGG